MLRPSSPTWVARRKAASTMAALVCWPLSRATAVEKQVHALLQPLVLEHQGIAHHDTGHAGILLAELKQHRHDAGHLLAAVARARAWS
jgi:hypothetical protein